MKESTPDSEVSLLMYTAEKSEPRRLSATKLPHDQKMVVDKMLTRIKELKEEGLETINLYNCWLERRLVLQATRAHWIY